MEDKKDKGGDVVLCDMTDNLAGLTAMNREISEKKGWDISLWLILMNVWFERCINNLVVSRTSGFACQFGPFVGRRLYMRQDDAFP